MGEGVDPVDGPRLEPLGLPLDGPGHVVYTAHGGDDPDLVAHRRPAVLPSVALEQQVVGGGQGGVVRLIAVLQYAPQAGLDVVGVRPPPGGDVLLGHADGRPILDYSPARGDVGQGELVPLGDVLQQGDGLAVHLEGGPGGQGRQSHRHQVAGMDLDKGFHGYFTFPFPVF